MKTSVRVCVVLPFLLGALLVGATTAQAKSDPDKEKKEIRAMRDTVLAELYKLHPDAKAKVKKAASPLFRRTTPNSKRRSPLAKP